MRSNKLGLKLGTDPEWGATHLQSDGKLYVIPPVFFRGDLGVSFTENGRHPIFYQDPIITVHEDGAAFEASVEPDTNWEALFDKVQVARQAIQGILEPFKEYFNQGVTTLPTLAWDVERWKDRGKEFHFATRFGCDPDQDAFEQGAKCKVDNAALHPFRYMGGHIHFSGDPIIAEQPLRVVRALASTVGLAAFGYSPVPDLDKERTFRYGKPGKYRVQKYSNGDRGIEYRTASTAWTGFKDLAEKIFDYAFFCFEEFLPSGQDFPFVEKYGREITRSIIECDQKTALELLALAESSV